MAAARDVKRMPYLTNMPIFAFVDLGLLKEYTYAHDLFTGIENRYPIFNLHQKHCKKKNIGLQCVLFGVQGSFECYILQ